MLAFAYYLLKVIICSLVLYSYYLLFLRNKIYHSYNRFFLLITVVLSLSLPLLKFNVWQHNNVVKPGVIQLLQVVNNSDEYMDEIIIQSRYDHVNKEMIALSIFLVISFFFLAVLLRTFIKIYTLKKRSPQQHYNNINLIHTEDKRTPFSFFKDIFWNDAIDINSENGQRILRHELVHVQEKHSHDKLFLNIILIIFWCNPVFWFIRRELNLIHEFIADKKAVADGDTASFAAMILQAAYPGHRFQLTNNFFYSPIKRRLSMLTKNNMKVSYISRLLVLPLVVIVFAAFTMKAKTPVSNLPKDKIFTVVIDAGHGGSDQGATGMDGIFEKDLNLELVKQIKALNKNTQMNIILSRETDIYQDPKEKAEISNKANADLFISIHNAYSDNAASAKSGMEIFVSKSQFANSEKSKLLASAVIASFQDNYGLDITKAPQQREQGIWVLQATKCPAVLIEAGYLSSKKDMTYLRSAEGKEQFAKNILNAISLYLNNNNSSGNLTINNINAADTNPKTENSKETTADDFKKIIAKSIADTFVKANQSVVINGKDYTTAKKLNDLGSQNKITPLIVLDGKITEMKSLNHISSDRIEAVKVLKGEQALSSYGQKGKEGVIEVTLKSSETFSPPDTTKIFSKVEQEADFPGGKTAWTEYLRKHLDASLPVMEGWKSGTYRIVVEFIVNQDGSVTDIKTNDYPNSKTAQACIALIKNGPNWNPARQNGKIVKAYRKQPVTFVVSEQ